MGYKIQPWNFVMGLMNEFCGVSLLTFVITLSAARWPTMGSIMYGLAVYWCLQMHPERLFNPVLNLFFRPMYFEALEKPAKEDTNKRRAFYLLYAVFEVVADFAGAFATIALIRGLTDNAIPADPYVQNKDQKYGSLIEAHGSYHKKHDLHNGIGSYPILATFAELIGILLLWKAAYDKPPSSRSVTFGIATSIASFCLAQFSGGFCNMAIHMATAAGIGSWNVSDENMKQVAFITCFSSLFLLALTITYHMVVRDVFKKHKEDTEHDYRPAWMKNGITLSDLVVRDKKGNVEGTIYTDLAYNEKSGSVDPMSSKSLKGSSWDI